MKIKKMNTEEKLEEILKNNPEKISCIAFDKAKSMTLEEVEKLNNEEKARVYNAVGFILCHTNKGLTICKEIADGDLGYIAPGFEKEVNAAKLAMQLGMARSIGYAVASIEKRRQKIDEGFKEIDKAFADFDKTVKKAEKLADKKVKKGKTVITSGYLKVTGPYRDKNGRFVKKPKVDMKVSVKEAKKAKAKKSGKKNMIEWF
jgi:chaperonin cofactor prefoldin